MTTLTDFLLDRIREDMADARLSDGTEPPPLGYWDNDRVLAECETKWEIRAEHLPVGYRNRATGVTDEYCPTCVTPKDPPHSYPCKTIRALASAYAEHPDYREEWRP